MSRWSAARRRRAGSGFSPAASSLGLGGWLAPLLAGCGYAVGFDDAGSGRSVGIEVVDNRTYRQRIEIPLTRALTRALPIHTGWHPTDPDHADVVLRVEIVDVDGRRLVGAGGGVPMREGALDFAVRARLVDARDGALLRDVRVVDRAEFRIPVGETEETALDEAAADLARKIALALEAGI